MAMVMDLRLKFRKEKNIDLNFSGSKFSEEGTITFLKLSVTCFDGFKGSMEASEDEIRKNKVGFVRSYKDPENPFTIGIIK